MNKIAQYLGMKNTVFANSHGLSDHRNKSTAHDLILLTVNIVKTSEKFRNIVSTKVY